MTERKINRDELHQYLMNTGQIPRLAMKLGGIDEGEGKEHKQPCPFCGGDDRFLYGDRIGKFQCRRCKENGKWYSIYDLVMRCQGVGFEEALRKVAVHSGFFNNAPYVPATEEREPKASKRTGGKSKQFRKGTIKKTEYIYTDENGNPWHKIVRFDGIIESTGEPDKTCSQKQFRNGHWESGAPDRKIPYRLPDVLNADIILIVEGEKVADFLNRTLQVAGITNAVATTSPMGAPSAPLWRKFLKRYPPIADKRVVIIPDNDDPGMSYSRIVASAVLDANPTADVKIAELNDRPLPEGGDFVDWRAGLVDDGNDESAIIEKLFELCEQAEPVTPDIVETWKQSESARNEAAPPRSWQPFPLETLPCQLRHFVIEVSQSIGIDSANTATCVLSILSGVIGRTFHLIIKQGYSELAMIWAAMIADSGFGKSPALDKARKPIDQLQYIAGDKYQAEMEDYAIRLESYKQQLKKYTQGKSDLPITPMEPVMLRYFVSDSTTQALLPILSDNPYGVCLIRDELAAFFNAMDAYQAGKVDKQVYIEIHGGRFVQSDRKTGKTYIAARTPSVSIIGGIQSDIIRQTIRDAPDFLATGFGARFLMVYPPRESIRWNHNVVASAVESSYEGLIMKLLQCREYHTPDDPGMISMAPEAKELIFAFQNQHADDSLSIADGNVRYVENKAGMHCARLCLVLHVVKCVESGIDPVSPVTSETMEQAITLTEWFLNEAHRIYAMFAGERVDGELTDKQRLVVLVLERKEKPLTSNEVRFGSNPTKRMTIEEIEQTLRELIQLGWVQSNPRQHKDGKGAPAIEYSIVKK